MFLLFQSDGLRMAGQLEPHGNDSLLLRHCPAARHRLRNHVPSYNTLFVNLAPNSQRGTATSTYLTSWDVGLGIGMLTGGYIAEIASFRMAYLFGSALTVVSMIYFRVKAGPHFLKNKLH